MKTFLKFVLALAQFLGLATTVVNYPERDRGGGGDVLGSLRSQGWSWLIFAGEGLLF